MFSSLLFLAENETIDGVTIDEGDIPGMVDKGFDRVETTFNVMSVVIPVFIVLVIGLIIFTAVRNYRAAKRHGMDPFAVETELAGRVYNSALLAPPPGASQPGQAAQHAGTKAERLQEIEDLYRNGAITSAERQRARDAVLTED